MLDWLRDKQVASGDAVAQHGFTHRRAALDERPRAQLARALAGGSGVRVPGLDAAETKSEAVESGRRVLKLARGSRPRGFVAPGYAYTLRAARSSSRTRFEWWGEAAGRFTATVAGPAGARRRSASGAPAVIKRATSPVVIRAGALLSPLRCSPGHPSRGLRSRAPRGAGARRDRARGPVGGRQSRTTTFLRAERSRRAERLTLAAEQVLRNNWREGVRGDGTPYAFTCPSTPRYRHQWYWDSCLPRDRLAALRPAASPRGAAHSGPRRDGRRIHPPHRVLGSQAGLATRAVRRNTG